MWPPCVVLPAHASSYGRTSVSALVVLRRHVAAIRRAAGARVVVSTHATSYGRTSVSALVASPRRVGDRARPGCGATLRRFTRGRTRRSALTDVRAPSRRGKRASHIGRLVGSGPSAGILVLPRLPTGQEFGQVWGAAGSLPSPGRMSRGPSSRARRLEMRYPEQHASPQGACQRWSHRCR
jgi:hypothetical protein